MVGRVLRGRLPPSRGLRGLPEEGEGGPVRPFEAGPLNRSKGT